MRTALLLLGIIWAVDAALLASPARAQRLHDEGRPARCEAAAAAVMAHATRPREVAGAHEELVWCPQAGAVLARLWAAPPADTASLALLAERSASVADGRLMAATMQLVSRAGVPEPVRRAALRVALAQYEPSIGFDDRGVDDPNEWAQTFTADYSQHVGTQPVTERDRAAMREALRRVTVDEAGTRWGRAAQRVARWLSGWERLP